MITCPKCHSQNQSMFEFNDRQREQVHVLCNICSHSFVYKFDVPPDELVKKPKKEVKDESKRNA